MDTGISAREAEVLAALGEHRTNAEIAATLVLSVRTVESHVSSLLRKLGAADRRELAAHAAARAVAPAPALPAALSSFVGRAQERTALAAMLEAHRLVTATGTGGVGKTRLALAVAGDVADRFGDVVWVDLVPAAEARTAAAVAAGARDLPGRTVTDALVARLGDRRVLLVLDNCEHLLDDVAALVEAVLARCPRTVVLATSRTRLHLPFEVVLPVSGLAEDDAVTLFRDRARATGSVVGDTHLPRIARIVRALDGVALAIELAAARSPAVGVDGVEAALTDRLPLLAAPRGNRHGSLRAALDWSHDLLHGSAQVLLRRLWTFAAPFPATAATVVARGTPLPEREILPGLAALADHHLVQVLPGPGGTRHRLLETVRQYAAERAREAGEEARCRDAHLAWTSAHPDVPLDDLRAAAAFAGERRPDAACGALLRLAATAHARGALAEAQRSAEDAATYAPDAADAAAALRRAAGSAAARLAADDAVRLLRAAAARAGDVPAAASDLARAAELVHRARYCFADPPSPDTAATLIGQARGLAREDPDALARIAVAEAFARRDEDPGAPAAAERARVLAGATGDPRVESAALDRTTTLLLHRGDVAAAAATARRRWTLLAPLAVDAELGFERPDGLVMVTETALAAGDLAAALHHAQETREAHPGDGHLAVARLAVVSAVSGDWVRSAATAPEFRAGWERAGRPRLGDVRRAAVAIAVAHGALDDVAGEAVWREIAAALTPADPQPGDDRAAEVLDALLLLHRGDPDPAVDLLDVPDAAFTGWLGGLWRPWHVALSAEARALAGRSDPDGVIGPARTYTTGNPVAGLLVERAAALAAGDRDAVRATASRLADAGSPYQAERSAQLAAGGGRRAR